MMCGCGSTGEREPLTVLSLFHSLRAPCCIPVSCAYFGNSCSAPPFFFPVLLYTVCVLLLHFSFSCSPQQPLVSIYPLHHPASILYCQSFSWPGEATLLELLIVFFCSFFCTEQVNVSEESERGDEIMVFTAWLTAGASGLSGDTTSQPLFCRALNLVLYLLLGHPLSLYVMPAFMLCILLRFREEGFN